MTSITYQKRPQDSTGYDINFSVYTNKEDTRVNPKNKMRSFFNNGYSSLTWQMVASLMRRFTQRTQ
uniref:Putative ovule protein n=1 Tax=Solanum chacoense TaxID=4108 RepID=A0A0V0HGK4_SOLCH